MPMPSQTPAPLPWYDDRVKQIRSESASSWGHADNNIPTPWDDAPAPDAYDTPRKIYDFLNARVWRQDDAKQAAAMVMYLCLRGLKTNAMFVGPTGCGKTHIWHCLREIFPERISIVDGSDITLSGWKGEKKWTDLLCSPAILSGESAALVIDEADKMLAPKYSQGENVSHSVQAEGLTMLEGSLVTIKDGPVVHEVDTSKISFILCGAFSKVAHDIAAQTNQRHIGFGVAQSSATQPYDQPLDEQDLIDFGVMPEFLGRIQRIVNLQPMLMDDYYRMMEAPHGVLSSTMATVPYWPLLPGLLVFPQITAIPWVSGVLLATCILRTYWGLLSTTPWTWDCVGRAVWGWMEPGCRRLSSTSLLIFWRT